MKSAILPFMNIFADDKAHPTYELGQAGAQKLAPHMSNIGTNMMEHTSPMIRRMGQGISNITSKIRFK